MPNITIPSKPCPGCGRILLLEVTEFQILLYNSGELIQNAFPNLTSEERESLVTGYCDPCWDKLFKED